MYVVIFLRQVTMGLLRMTELRSVHEDIYDRRFISWNGCTLGPWPLKSTLITDTEVSDAQDLWSQSSHALVVFVLFMAMNERNYILRPHRPKYDRYKLQFILHIRSSLA